MPALRLERRLAGLLLVAAACSGDFTPRSVLEDLRVLAIEATPLEVLPGESVTLTPKRLAPPGAEPAPTIDRERWTFCPFSIGATVGFACAVPACEVVLYDGAASGDEVTGVSVTADPGALTQQCLAQLAAQGAPPPDAPSELPPTVDTVFRYTALASDGRTREAVQLVPFYLVGAPPERNLPPVITGVRIGGGAVEAGSLAPVALAPGSQVDVEVDVRSDSRQRYRDAAGNDVEETLVVSFFTTAGRFDFDRANVPGANVKLKHEEIASGVDEARLWVVATDLRGGQAVAGPFRVPVTR